MLRLKLFGMVARQDENRQEAMGRQVANGGHQGKPVTIRHFQVSQQEVTRRIAQYLKSGLAIGDRDHFEIQSTELLGHPPAYRCAIVSMQNRFGHENHRDWNWRE